MAHDGRSLDMGVSPRRAQPAAPERNPYRKADSA
jgi:hypothetical protein